MGDTHYGGVVAAEGIKVGTKYSKTTVIDASGNIVNAPSITRPYTLVAVDTTLTADQSGGVFGLATDDKTFTLPAVAEGLVFTFINVGADGNNLLDVAITDGVIAGTFTLAASVVVVSVATTISNTQSTANKGDFVTLESDGVGWFITASSGIWEETAP